MLKGQVGGWYRVGVGGGGWYWVGVALSADMQPCMDALVLIFYLLRT